MEKKILSRTLFETYSALANIHYTQHAQEEDESLIGKIPEEKKPIYYPVNASAINEFLGFPKKFGETSPRLRELEKHGYIRRINPKEFSKGIGGYKRDHKDVEGDSTISPIVNSTRWYIPLRQFGSSVWSEEILSIPHLDENELESFIKKVGSAAEFISSADKLIKKTESILFFLEDDSPTINYSEYHWINGIEHIQNFYLKKWVNPESMQHENLIHNLIDLDDEKVFEFSVQEMVLFWLIYSNKFEKVISSKFSDDDFRKKNLKNVDERARRENWELFTRFIGKLVQDNRKDEELLKIINGFEVINKLQESNLDHFSEKEKGFLKVFFANDRVNYFFEDLLNKRFDTPYRYLDSVLRFYHVDKFLKRFKP